jgi:serine/threonine protein kinase
MAEQLFHEGSIFEGRYRIIERLGEGGFASVYRAIQTDLEREVAIKLLNPEEIEDGDAQQRDPESTAGTGDKTVAKRFEREAKLLSQLKDPHTVTVFDYGQTDDGLFYMILEHVDGTDLEHLLSDETKVNPKRTVKILRQVLSSLQEAHAKGVLHRDLKPGNIMIYKHLGEADQVKLIDFGIAGQIMGSDSKITKDLTIDQMALGTPRYMAPERIEDSEPGPASDLYAIGLITYEMLTGQKAIPGENAIEVFGKQIKSDSVQLAEDVDVPPKLRKVVNKLLQKPLENRYQDTTEVIDDLEQVEFGHDNQTAQSNDDTTGREPDVPETKQLKEDPPAGEIKTTTSYVGDDEGVYSAVPRSETSAGKRLLRALPFWPLVIGIMIVQIGVGGYLIFSALQTSATGSADKTSKPEKVAENETPNPGDNPNKDTPGNRDEPENKQLTISDDDLIPATPNEEDHLKNTLEIRTEPTKLEIRLNGDKVGYSPVAVKRKGLEFPLEIVAARPNGLTESVTLDSFQSVVTLTFENPYPPKRILRLRQGRNR